MRDFLRRHIGPSLTQARLSKTLGVDRSLVSHWLAGRLIPSPRHLQALLDLVNASADERAEAWALLAQADAARSGEPRHQAEAA